MTKYSIEKGVLQSAWGDDEILRIPDSVREIADFSLSDCKQARHIYISEKVRSVGDYALCALNKVEDIQVHQDNKNFFARDGVLFERKKTANNETERLVYYPAAKKAEAYVVPETVSDIAHTAFKNAQYLKCLTFPDSLRVDSHGSLIDFPRNIEEIIVPSISNINPRKLLKVKSVKIYPSKRSQPPHREFHRFIEEDGSLFVQIEFVGASVNHALFDTMPIQYNKDLTGEVFLLTELHEFGKKPFDGCEKITGVIVPKCPISANGYPSELDFDLGRPIPLTMPRIYYNEAANEATKINLLLGYLAHPEFYNDDSGYAEGMYRGAVARQKAKLLPCIFQMDRPDLLKYYADRNYITKRNFQETFLTPAEEAGAEKCVSFLTQWQQEKNSQLQEENGLQFEVMVADQKKTGEKRLQKHLLRCDPNKTGDVMLPFELTQIAADAFAGCDAVTAIIAPKFAESSFSDAFCKGKTIPLVFPQVDFKAVKDKNTKINLLLGYLAHPEYYDDIVTGYFSSNTIGEDYLDSIIRMRQSLLPYVFALDRPEMLAIYADRKKIDKKNFAQMYMTPAQEAKAEKCVAFLKKWQAEHL